MYELSSDESPAIPTGGSPRSTGLGLRAFYLVKPLIPRRAQVTARRIRAKRIWRRLGRDPLAGLPSEPLGYRWPHRCGACALLTHDVESDRGQRRIPALVELEERYAIRSCWNFVAHRYEVDTAMIASLQAAGHEIGVHGVRHDGREFESEAVFMARLGIAEQVGRRWGAAGFRSPSLMYDLEMLRTLPFAWDSSMPAWDPFQPMPRDCHNYVPFRLSERCVELPVTLWQDFTLFEELRLEDIDVWRRQADAIYDAGGLITVIVHPDYALTPQRLAHYEALLAHLRDKPNLWFATPSEVVAWEHRRRKSDHPAAARP
jgi:peptidoglycan/xylan/chitin deacetylase (PgdA/CDA1 family)